MRSSVPGALALCCRGSFREGRFLGVADLLGVVDAEFGEVALGEDAYPLGGGPAIKGGGVAMVVVGHGESALQIVVGDRAAILSSGKPAGEVEGNGDHQREREKALGDWSVVEGGAAKVHAADFRAHVACEEFIGGVWPAEGLFERLEGQGLEFGAERGEQALASAHSRNSKDVPPAGAPGVVEIGDRFEAGILAGG